jgi:hypothetical protein
LFPEPNEFRVYMGWPELPESAWPSPPPALEAPPDEPDDAEQDPPDEPPADDEGTDE